MFDALTPYIFATITFPIVMIMQRWIHRHLQGVTLLMTGNRNWSIIVYAIVLFPGVLLHELSHWLTANLLGVRTGRLSLWPKAMKDGSLRLGYVEYFKSANVGPVRESLIGGAPLVFGTAAVLLIGFYVFGLSDLALAIDDGNPDTLSRALNQMFAANDFWMWLYLLFAISNAMMPSPSDRKAWPAFFAITAVFIAVLYFLGFSQFMWSGIVGPVATAFFYLGVAFSMTIAVNIVFMGVIVLIEWGISQLRGAHIDYSRT